MAVDADPPWKSATRRCEGDGWGLFGEQVVGRTCPMGRESY